MPNNINETTNPDIPSVFNSLTLRLLLIPKIGLIFSTVFFNICIIIVIAFMVKKKTVSNCFFLSISISDTIVGVSSMSFMTLYTSYGYWPLGINLCRFWIIFDYSSCTVSIFSLMYITVQRYRQLTSPFKVSEDFTKKKFGILIGIWICSHLFWLAGVIPITGQPDFSPEACYFSYTFTYVLLADLFGYGLPIIILVFFNYLTYRALRVKMTRVTNYFKNTAVTEGTTSTKARPIKTLENNKSTLDATTTITGKTGSESKKQMKQNSDQKVSGKDKKAVICLISISSILVFCWAIFLVTWPILAYCVDCVNPVLYQVGYWTVYFNATLNPICLLTYHEHFRQEFMRLIFCRWCKK